jgi:hypothetical protein
MLNINEEKKLSKILTELKNNFGLRGIKAEFEAEGSSLEDIYRLKKICARNNVKIYVKIGGVEAVRDIYDCIDIGVDGIIAPMVETGFGAKKFLDCIKKFDLKKIFHLSINIETASGHRNYNTIFDILKNNINNITIGRTDLSASYFTKEVNPESRVIHNVIKDIYKKNKKTNLTTTIGGSISRKTFDNYNKDFFYKKINKNETRKVILDSKFFFRSTKALEKALEFEEHYILYKKSNFDLRFNDEFQRLTKLKNRI